MIVFIFFIKLKYSITFINKIVFQPCSSRLHLWKFYWPHKKYHYFNFIIHHHNQSNFCGHKTRLMRRTDMDYAVKIIKIDLFIQLSASFYRENKYNTIIVLYILRVSFHNYYTFNAEKHVQHFDDKRFTNFLVFELWNV